MYRLIVLAIVIAMLPGTARAVVIPVDSTADAHDMSPGDGTCLTSGGECTLRAAIEEVAALAAPPAIVTIEVPPGVYALTLGDLAPSCVGCALGITGAGPASTTLDGGFSDVTMAAGSALLVDGLAMRHVRLQGSALDIVECEITDNDGYAVTSDGAAVTITDSSLLRNGGGVDASFGTLLADRVRIAECGNGAGVAVEGTQVTVRDSEISDNAGSAITGSNSGVRVERTTMARNSYGVAICGITTEIAVLESALTDHQAAGIESGDGLIRVEDSTLARNRTYGVRGDFCHGGRPRVHIARSTVDGNLIGIFVLSAGLVDGLVVEDTLVRGSVFNGVTGAPGADGGGARIERSWITANGAGVFFEGFAGRPFTATIDASTVSDNGEGIGLAGFSLLPPGSSVTGVFVQATIQNTTITNNGHGGGIIVSREGVHTSIRSGTITKNHGTPKFPGDPGDGGGISTPADGGNVTTVSDTIIAGNTSDSGNGPDCTGPLVSEGHVLLGDPTGCTVTGDPTGNLLGVDPLLAPLAENGGPTPTHALLPGSPALDAGGASCPATDQRGIARPQGAACDIGALEDTCGNGTVDPGEPCSCPPRPAGSCATTTTTTTSTTSFTGTSITTTTGTQTTTTGTESSTTTSSTTTSTTLVPAQTILGNSLTVKDPKPGVDPSKRKIVGSAKEKNSPNLLLGDPTQGSNAGGAILQVFANGATPSAQTFVLAQGTSAGGKPFWSGSASKGFKYKDPRGERGPVKTVSIKRSSGGSFSLKAVVSGKNGVVAVVPPNPGTDGCMALDLGIDPAQPGDRYSVRFGPEATVKNRADRLFEMTKPTVEGDCPTT